MEFVTASTSGWDDPWVLGLDLEHHQVWHYLIYGPDFASGHSFAERNPVMWPIRMKLSMDQIDGILRDFEADGKVKICGDVVWVVRGIHYQRLGSKGNNLRNALQKIHAQYGNKAPDLVDEAMEMYNRDGVYTGYTRCGLNRSNQIISNHIKSNNTSAGSDEPTAADQLKELESGMSDNLLAEWKSFKAMCAEQRRNGRVSDSVLLKHLQPILDSQLTDDAKCYGLAAAIKAGADNHTYVLKAAGSYGSQRKPDQPTPQKKLVVIGKDDLGGDIYGYE